MSFRISSPKFTVPRAMFDRAVETFSGRLLWYEKIKEPIAWEGRHWVVTTMMLSHGTSWANLYEVVPIADWDGDVYVFGCFDEQWIEERARSGLFWHGVKVQIENEPLEYVLAAKVRWQREKQPKPPETGQSS
tara:strand:- start:10340 stop:10738 length:399 start_codon:yes stop_codon:yes gene_type:complete